MIIRQKIKEILGLGDISIERPANAEFGDYSTSAVLKLAKEQKKNPFDLARELAQKIASQNDGQIFAKIEAVKPGFINFTLSTNFLRQQITEILAAGEKYGESELGKRQKVQIEFISANPTGPLTLGNGRGGFYGDVLANVLVRAGYSIQRAYYINDAGYQVEVLGHSILKDEQAQYRGEYIDRLRDQLKSKLDLSAKEIGRLAWVIIWNDLIRPVIENKMKIKFDEWVSEQEIINSGLPKKMLEALQEKNLIYEKDGAAWFKSTEFGDDKDRVLITSAKEGRGEEATYLLPDIAYHYKKFTEDKFDKVIDVWGADHYGYVARLQAAGKALGVWNEENLKIVIMQLVRLFKDGKEVRMSKRAGTYITLDELLDEISLDVARWFFLTRSADTHMDFDLDLAKEQSEKNPVYYVQYAHARICSILRKAISHQPLATSLSNLTHPAELALVKQLIRLPEIIEDTARDYQVHRLPQYALDLVRQFHKFYEECRVINEDNLDLTQARLALCEATRVVLSNVLSLMGISAPEKM